MHKHVPTFVASHQLIPHYLNAFCFQSHVSIVFWTFDWLDLLGILFDVSVGQESGFPGSHMTVRVTLGQGHVPCSNYLCTKPPPALPILSMPHYISLSIHLYHLDYLYYDFVPVPFRFRLWYTDDHRHTIYLLRPNYYDRRPRHHNPTHQHSLGFPDPTHLPAQATPELTWRRPYDTTRRACVRRLRSVS